MSEMINPIQMVADVNDQWYLLLGRIIADDDTDDYYIHHWEEFQSKKELYDFIKESLEGEKPIDLEKSTIIVEGQTYTRTKIESVNPITKSIICSDRMTALSFMIVTAPLYGDTFNPKLYIPNYGE